MHTIWISNWLLPFTPGVPPYGFVLCHLLADLKVIGLSSRYFARDFLQKVNKLCCVIFDSSFPKLYDNLTEFCAIHTVFNIFASQVLLIYVNFVLCICYYDYITLWMIIFFIFDTVNLNYPSIQVRVETARGDSRTDEGGRERRTSHAR